MIQSIDDAIQHCIEVAEKNEKQANWFWGKEGNPNYEKCLECASDHRQLAEWLKELKRYKDERVGCEYCKHRFREQYERPCSLCKHNFKDMFESEVNADD